MHKRCHQQTATAMFDVQPENRAAYTAMCKLANKAVKGWRLELRRKYAI